MFTKSFAQILWLDYVTKMINISISIKSEMWSCEEAWWVGEGIKRLFLPYYYLFFWLASPASISDWEEIFANGPFSAFSMILKFSMGHFLSFYTDFDGPFSKLMGLCAWPLAFPITAVLHVYILPCSMFSMERSSFLYISLIQITSHPCFYERAFSYFSFLELHDFTLFKPKIFWGRNPRSPSPHSPYTFTISKLSCHMRVCVERGLQLYKKTMPLPKINLYVPVNNCLESRFKPYFCRRERTTTTLRYLPSLLLNFFFFFAFQNVRKGWLPPPPPDENSWIRTWRVLEKWLLSSFCSTKMYMSLIQ